MDANLANLLRDTSGEPPYNTNTMRLSDPDIALLTQNGYRLQPDGTVVSSASSAPVGRSEMTWLLQEFQWSLALQPAPANWEFALSVVVPVLVFLGGAVLFEQMERGFADVI